MNPLNGRMRVFELEVISTGAGYCEVPLRPPGMGIEWQIVWATGKHDDPAGASVGWGFYDPDNPTGLWLPTMAKDAGELIVLGTLPSNGSLMNIGPFFATWDRYPCYRFYTVEVGMKGTVTPMVIERVGVEALE